MIGLVLTAAVLAFGGLAYLLGLRRGEGIGRRRGRADLEAIARAAAEESNREARELGRERLDAVAAPLRESLLEVRKLTSDLEERRARDHGGLAQLAERLSRQVESVEKSNLSLREALKGDRQARGRWGEVQLRTVVESVGLAPHLDFETQADADGARPDLALRLPGGARLAVDAKTPMDDFLAGAEAPSGEMASESFARHARRVRSHIDALAKRGYPERLGDGPPFTVLFLPLEALLTEAVRRDPDLLPFAGERRVVLATPHTLMGLLWAVASLWRAEAGTRNAEELRRTGLEVERRLSKFLARFADVGLRLGKATDAYNQAVGSADHLLLPQLRRLRELSGSGAASAGSLPEPVETAPRPLTRGPAPQEQADSASS